MALTAGHRFGRELLRLNPAAGAALEDLFAGRGIGLAPELVGAFADLLRGSAGIPSQTLRSLRDWCGQDGRQGASRVPLFPFPASPLCLPNVVGGDTVLVDLARGPVVIEGRRHFTLRLASRGAVCGGVILKRCEDFVIEAEHELSANPRVFHPKWLIELADCSAFSILSLRISGSRNAVGLHRCRDGRIESLRTLAAEGYGLAALDCSRLHVGDSVFERSLASGIGLFGACHDIHVRNCEVEGSTGFYNCDAGIHCCNTSERVGWDDVPERAHEALSIEQKTKKPARILIDACRIRGCRAQGIYLEGTVLSEIRHSLISGNNKEGICFDWGTSACHFHDNTVVSNGARAGLSPEEVAADFIGDFPMLPDGSASIKLPGVAMDNGCLNALDGNVIRNNFGGGIKLVRAASFNSIRSNVIENNAVGSNRHFKAFHGVACLAVGVIGGEFDQTSSGYLDLTPSLMNSLRDNVISRHYENVYAVDARQFFRPSDNLMERQSRVPVSRNAFSLLRWLRAV